ncbi:hypothetical protein [Polaromonas sp. DSR2-3-2]|uniref:hypothetical protein n=1 Tax=unclassified Polaromonas TaxID=2638319 RepID=UPI003CF8D46E
MFLHKYGGRKIRKMQGIRCARSAPFSTLRRPAAAAGTLEAPFFMKNRPIAQYQRASAAIF